MLLFSVLHALNYQTAAKHERNGWTDPCLVSIASSWWYGLPHNGACSYHLGGQTDEQIDRLQNNLHCASSSTDQNCACIILVRKRFQNVGDSCKCFLGRLNFQVVWGHVTARSNPCLSQSVTAEFPRKKSQSVKNCRDSRTNLQLDCGHSCSMCTLPRTRTANDTGYGCYIT